MRMSQAIEQKAEQPNWANHDEEPLVGPRAVEKVQALLKHFRSTMMVTQVNNAVHSRPMGLQGHASDFNGTLWFFTDDRSRKSMEVGNDTPMWLVFQSDDHSAYMQLSGTATHVNDRGKMEQLYTPLLKTWFPKGLDEPHLTLIRFEARNGNFWDSPGGMLQVLAAFTKSVVTGTPGKGGESGELRL